MKKILLIDNTFDPPHGSPEIQQCLWEAARKFGPVEITVVRAPESAVPTDLERFDGAVLSGSKTRAFESAPWIDLEMAAIRTLFAKKIPTLGICYGEQLIARTFGGDAAVGAAKENCREYGWAEIQRKGDSPILKDLPASFHSFEFHQDEVRSLPKNFRLTATNPACPIQAYDVEGAPMWGVQFHPERGPEAGRRSLDNKKKADPGIQLIHPEKGEELHNPDVAATIFKNFLAQVWGKA